ncbi:hypothetical protein RMCBS344292_13168 [Rhizopus microsporus]|nr:hypothetical protein RMCBS344292_13168 [Rhizopus microsporus]
MAEEIVPINQQEEKVNFFKKRSTNKNIRKRKLTTTKQDSDEDVDSEEDEDGSAAVSEVVTKSRKTGLNPFVQSTRKKRKNNNNQDEEEEEDGFGVHYAADKSTDIKKNDATRYDTEWELENKEIQQKKDSNKKNALNSKMSVGPQRAPANLRVTARFDYQPDVYWVLWIWRFMYILA